MKKKTFFGCSMRGGFPYVNREFLQQIPKTLEDIGLELMSKHQTQEGILDKENQRTTIEIHDRDYGWLEECELCVFEISNPSSGAGGEIADAVRLDRPILALYQRPEHEISAYIRGKLEKYPKGRHAQYRELDDLKRITREFIDSIQP